MAHLYVSFHALAKGAIHFEPLPSVRMKAIEKDEGTSAEAISRIMVDKDGYDNDKCCCWQC